MSSPTRKVASGHIPETIIYVFNKNKYPVRIQWDEGADDHSEEVWKAFPLDAGSKTTIHTARRWATKFHNYDEKDNKPPEDVIEIRLPNEPIEGLQIFNLEERMQGGRAYKVVITVKHPESGELYDLYVDMREEAVMDALVNESIDRGVMSGRYVWAQLHTQLRLVRVGSTIFKAISEAGRRKKLDVVKTEELEIGTVYQTKKAERWLYLGQMNSIEYTQVQPPHFSNESDYWSRNVLSPALFGTKAIKNHGLWLRMHDCYGATFTAEPGDYYRFDLKEKLVVVEEVEKLVLPPDWLEQIRSLFLGHLQATAQSFQTEYNKDNNPERRYGPVKNFVAGYICDGSEFLNMQPVGTPVTLHPFLVEKFEGTLKSE